MHALRETLVLMVVALAPAALAVAFHPELAERARAGLEPGAVRLVEVRAWQTNVLWIDARSAGDFARDRIPGAVHLDEARFSEQLGAVLAAWQPDARLVVYCSTLACGASKAVAQRLREAGLPEVFHLHGGWEAWVAARAP